MARPSTSEGYEALYYQEKASVARPEAQEVLLGPVHVDSVAQRPQRSLFRRVGRLAVFLNLVWVSYYLGKHWLPLDSMFAHESKGNAAPMPPTFENQLLFNGETVRSNGTHDYKRAVLLVSIDGLRSVVSCYQGYRSLIRMS